MPKGKRGPVAGTEQARRGGQAMKAQYGAAFFQAIGKKGGAAASERLGPEGYRAIGQKGGETTRDKHGADFFRRIGKLGGEHKRRIKHVQEAIAPDPRPRLDEEASS
jgi:general stress protein YciG